MREFTERFDHAEVGPDELLVDARELEAAIGVLEPSVLDGLRTAIDERPGGRQGAASRPGQRRARAGSGRGGRGGAGPARGDLRAGRPGAVRLDGRHGSRDGACSGRRADRGLRATRPGRPRSPRDPRRLRALRGHRGLPDGRGAGDRHARLRLGGHRARGRDRRPRQRIRAGGEAPARVHGDRDRRYRRPKRARRGRRRPGSGPGADRARPAGPGRARPGQPAVALQPGRGSP